jgi:hypothetical protein
MGGLFGAKVRRALGARIGRKVLIDLLVPQCGSWTSVAVDLAEWTPGSAGLLDKIRRRGANSHMVERRPDGENVIRIVGRVPPISAFRPMCEGTRSNLGLHAPVCRGKQSKIRSPSRRRRR